MPRPIPIPKITLATVGFLLVPALIFLYVKIEISHSTNVYDRIWSDSGTCYIDAYIPSYSKLGILGKAVALFSGNGFYRVYDKDDKELRSSEWILWQRDYPDLEGPSWVNGHVFYATADGYAGWSFPECN